MPCFVPCDNCPNHISCLEALDRFTSFGFGARKAYLVDIAFLPAAMPARRNQQRHNASDLERVRRALPDTGRVNPVRFRKLSLRAIELGQAP